MSRGPLFDVAAGASTGVALVAALLIFAYTPSGPMCRFFVEQPPAAPPPGDRPGLTRVDFADRDFQRVAARSEAPDLAPPPGVPACRWLGRLAVPESGTYALGLVTTASALIVLDGRAAATNWLPHDLTARWSHVYLTQGPHALRVDFATAPDATALAVRWVPPGRREPEPLPAALFTHGDPPAVEPVPRPYPTVLLDEHQPRIAFSHPEALNQPYITRWHAGTMGHPSELAPLAAIWEGLLSVPRGQPVTVALEGTAEGALEVDGHRVTKRAEDAAAELRVSGDGRAVPFRVEARDPGVLRRLALVWQPPGEPRAPVPAEALAPPAAHDGPARGAVPALVLLAVLALAALSRCGGPAAYARFVRAHARHHAWALLVLAGALLRLHGYASTPPPGETMDEFAHHTIGGSLLDGGVPFGWDFREGYAWSRYVPVHGHTFNMVAPLVEWPPLMSVLTGLASRAAGATSPLDTPLEVTRLVPIALSVLTLALIWPVGRALRLSHAACFWATAFAAVYPISVMLSRLIKEDNLLAPLYLGTVWLLALPGLDRSIARRSTLGLLTVLALLTKQMGVALPALAGLIALRRGRPRLFVAAALYGALGLAAFAWYGTSHAGHFFVELQGKLGGYTGQLNALWPLIGTSRITETELGSGWIVGLWLAFFLFARSPRARRRTGLLVTAVVAYLVVLLVSYPAQFNFGWYRLPLFPLLFLACGDQCVRLTLRFDPLRVLIFAGLFLMPALDLLGTASGHATAFTGFIPPDWHVGWPRAAAILRSLVAAFVLPSLVLPLLARPVRRPVARALGITLATAAIATFAITAWAWEDIHPYARPGDDVLPTGEWSGPL